MLEDEKQREPHTGRIINGRSTGTNGVNYTSQAGMLRHSRSLPRIFDQPPGKAKAFQFRSRS